ncbi:MurR/RpiR family transcriptional regulator [Rhizobium brockwellii]|uniref:MurR/RpiR family transcriptional regulator n=1 Tax=Rhizobium brockwellii TaxID=3019932 RepID=A0ABU3YPD9_9HYPH|nr:MULTISPECIES: MurR/RpiR family transcriptional regulator [Rhizobium]MDV4180831.1 MurR/RpiR family transcriptional regulator [Rhizobium brockwellii]MDV4187697.1 MurR/RpiR family transcriptional regulator [Rhizobium brockwellii]
MNPTPHMALVASIRSRAPNMTRALQRVADYTLEDPQAVLYKSITELAEDAQSSEASVMRFCRELGFTGFQNFKLALAQELATQSQTSVPISTGDPVQNLVETARTALDETERLLDRRIIKAVAQELLQAKHIEIFGVAASAITAQYLEYKLARLGVHSHIARDAHLATMAAATSNPADVYFLISSSGSTLDTVKIAELAHARGARVIGITNRSKSPLAATCTHVLLASWPETPLTGGAFPSKISQLLIVDALASYMTMAEPDRLITILDTAQSVTDRNV